MGYYNDKNKNVLISNYIKNAASVFLRYLKFKWKAVSEEHKSLKRPTFFVGSRVLKMLSCVKAANTEAFCKYDCMPLCLSRNIELLTTITIK